MPDKFQPSERVFAKIKGWPPWPAKVLNRVDGKAESYMILFYGTYDKSVVKPDSMFAYNDENKVKYAKNKSSSRWKLAMEEIENNTPIGETGPLEEDEAPVEAMEVTSDTDDDSDVMVDEDSECQPPVSAKKPGKAVARRESKSSLSKRDSISSTSSAPDVTTPAAGSTTPVTEVIRRSGRKVKPKRFADEETSTPTPTKNKTPSSQDESSEGSPPKRAPRGGKTPTAVKSTPVVAEPKVEPQTRPKMVIGKGKGAPPPKTPPITETSTSTSTKNKASSSQDESSEGPPSKRAKRGGKTPLAVKSTPVVVEPKVETPTRPRGKGKGTPPKSPPISGEISPNISTSVPKVPTPKPAAAQKKADGVSPAVQVGKKSLPAVIPAAGTTQAAAPQVAAVPTVPLPVKRPSALRQQARQEVEEEKSVNEVLPTLETKEAVDISKKPASASPAKESVKRTPTSRQQARQEVQVEESVNENPATLENIDGVVIVKKPVSASASPTKEPVKPADPSKKTPLSLEAMMAAVASIRAPVIPTSPVKPSAASPASASISAAESPAASTAIKKRKVEKTYSRTPSAPVDKGIKLIKEGEDTSKKPTLSPKEFVVKPSDSSKKAAVSFEAMMAAVSSIKTPVTQKLKNKPTASDQLKIKHKIESGADQQPKLISASALAAGGGGQGQQPMSVEILREKSKGGGTTVVVVQQQQKGVDGVEVEVEGVGGDDDSEADSYDEYMYFDREFEFEHEEDIKADREFERFHSSLKKFLQLPGRWTMGGVQWDPQGKRKAILISEPEIPPNGRPIVKRCLQFFEDKSIRVFIDQMDMTDVFGMTCYAEKEDVASLVVRVADASSCCGVPEMVVDDLVYFPDVRKRNTSYFAPDCPGVIANDEYDPICTACKEMQILVKECRRDEKLRLQERRIRSEEKMFEHPFGKALYNMFDDLVDETDPSKPKKKRTKETFFRKFLHDTRLKVNGDSARTERVYIEKPISVDSVSQSFQDIVSKLGFNVPNAKKRPSGGLLPRPSVPTQTTTSTPRSTAVSRVFPGSTSNLLKMHQERKQSLEHISMPFTPGSSFTLDDGQEYELIGEVEPGQHEFVEMKANPTAGNQQQYEIIEVDDETLARLAGSKNQVVMLPESTTAGGSIVTSSGFPITTRIDANDPNLSQILKAINTSHGFKVS